MNSDKEESVKSIIAHHMLKQTPTRKNVFANLAIIALVGIIIIVAAVSIYLNPAILGTSSPAIVFLILGILLGVTDVVFAVYVFFKLKQIESDVDTKLKKQFPLYEENS